MTTQSTTATGEPAQDAGQNKYTQRDAAHASRETKRELLKQARTVATLAAAGHGPASPEVKEQARLLLKAAIDWQQSAVEAAAETGAAPRSRPNFQQEPKPPDLKAQPGSKKYHSRIFFWASRYAWDKRDGLDAREAARNLVLTAYVGYQPNQPDKTDQATGEGDKNART